MASIEADLLEGVALTLAAAVGKRTTITYRASGQYTSADGFGVYMDTAPPNLLDGITLSEYPVSDDITGGDSVVGVQARIVSRDRRRIKDAIGDVFDILHARWGGSLGTIRLIQAVRSSGANLGQDADGRQVRTENYYLTIYRR